MASSKKSGWISWRLLNNFVFYTVELLAPRQTPIPEDQASVFISSRCRVATHFSRLLRNAWATVGLFLFPGHHTGNIWLCNSKTFCWYVHVSYTAMQMDGWTDKTYINWWTGRWAMYGCLVNEWTYSHSLTHSLLTVYSSMMHNAQRILPF
jgi:hypothetical protein